MTIYQGNLAILATLVVVVALRGVISTLFTCVILLGIICMLNSKVRMVVLLVYIEICAFALLKYNNIIHGGEEDVEELDDATFCT